jgi:cbb3-type cytochrome oxidase subunit 3
MPRPSGAASHSTLSAAARAHGRRNLDMWVILLEAFGALALLLLIVWWTMFHGRRRGERARSDDAP